MGRSTKHLQNKSWKNQKLWDAFSFSPECAPAKTSWSIRWHNTLNINTTLRILMISSPTNVIIKFLLKDRIKGISHRIWIVEKDTGFSWNFHSDFSHFPVKQKNGNQLWRLSFTSQSNNRQLEIVGIFSDEILLIFLV